MAKIGIGVLRAGNERVSYTDYVNLHAEGG